MEYTNTNVELAEEVSIKEDLLESEKPRIVVVESEASKIHIECGASIPSQVSVSTNFWLPIMAVCSFVAPLLMLVSRFRLSGLANHANAWFVIGNISELTILISYTLAFLLPSIFGSFLAIGLTRSKLMIPNRIAIWCLSVLVVILVWKSLYVSFDFS